MSFLSSFIWNVSGVGEAFRGMRDQLTPRQNDVKLPQSEEGTPQAVTFGDVWSDAWMVLGAGNYDTEAIRTKSGK